jgi:hypothetical protein
MEQGLKEGVLVGRMQWGTPPISQIIKPWQKLCQGLHGFQTTAAAEVLCTTSFMIMTTLRLAINSGQGRAAATL